MHDRRRAGMLRAASRRQPAPIGRNGASGSDGSPSCYAPVEGTKATKFAIAFARYTSPDAWAYPNPVDAVIGMGPGREPCARPLLLLGHPHTRPRPRDGRLQQASDSLAHDWRAPLNLQEVFELRRCRSPSGPRCLRARKGRWKRERLAMRRGLPRRKGVREVYTPLSRRSRPWTPWEERTLRSDHLPDAAYAPCVSGRSRRIGTRLTTV